MEEVETAVFQGCPGDPQLVAQAVIKHGLTMSEISPPILPPWGLTDGVATCMISAYYTVVAASNVAGTVDITMTVTTTLTAMMVVIIVGIVQLILVVTVVMIMGTNVRAITHTQVAVDMIVNVIETAAIGVATSLIDDAAMIVIVIVIVIVAVGNHTMTRATDRRTTSEWIQGRASITVVEVMWAVSAIFPRPQPPTNLRLAAGH